MRLESEAEEREETSRRKRHAAPRSRGLALEFTCPGVPKVKPTQEDVAR